MQIWHKGVQGRGSLVCASPGKGSLRKVRNVQTGATDGKRWKREQ